MSHFQAPQGSSQGFHSSPNALDYVPVLPEPWQQPGSESGTHPDGHLTFQLDDPYVPLLAVRKLFEPLVGEMRANREELRQLRVEIAEQGRRLGTLATNPSDPGHEGDDERDGPSSSAEPARKRARKGKELLKEEELHGIQVSHVYAFVYGLNLFNEILTDATKIRRQQAIVRRVITEGCGVESFQDLTGTGLTDDDLELVDDEWDDPWRPGFTEAWSHARNKVWVKKIMNAVLSDEQVSGIQPA